MNDDAVRVSRIEFRAAMPLLRLLDAARLAFSIQCLLPAALGLILFLVANQFLFSPTRLVTNHSGPLPNAVPLPFRQIGLDAHVIAVMGFSDGLWPVARLLLNLLLMGFTGVAVSRAAGLKFCADRRSGAVRSLRHACQSARAIIISLFLGALLCLAALGVYLLLLKVTVLAAGDSHAPQSLAGIPAWLGALFLIAAGAVISVGWLLSLAATGVDSQAGAESLSRGISYVLSRFRRSCCYAAIILLITWFLTEAAAFLVTQAGGLVAQTLNRSTDVAVVDSPGFHRFRQFVVEAWKLSVFFSGVTLSYVLLRHAEDGVDLNEVQG